MNPPPEPLNRCWPLAWPTGVEATGKLSSGGFDLVKTEMPWPATHLFAPACAPCHSSAAKNCAWEPRLDNVPGV
jgi:hypothetical protein